MFLLSSHVQVLSRTLDMVVQRFSTSIQTCKSNSSPEDIPQLYSHDSSSSFIGPQKSQKLSAISDHQQREPCYRELHRVWLAVDGRLGHGGDSSDITTRLSALRTVLEPYSAVLAES